MGLGRNLLVDSKVMMHIFYMFNKLDVPSTGYLLAGHLLNWSVFIIDINVI